MIIIQSPNFPIFLRILKKQKVILSETFIDFGSDHVQMFPYRILLLNREEVETLFQMSGLSVPTEGSSAHMDLHLDQHTLQGSYISCKGGVQHTLQGSHISWWCMYIVQFLLKGLAEISQFLVLELDKTFLLSFL